MIKKNFDIPFKVICDFDGTISKNDTFDQLLERYADPVWQDIEAEWLKGKIGTGECMSRQMALINIKKQELDNWLSHIQIDKNFIKFVKFCKNVGIEVSIASDGVDYIIKNILRNYRLDFLKFESNKLVFKKEGKYELSFAKKSSLCESGSMVCKCSVAQKEKDNKKIIPQTILIRSEKEEEDNEADQSMNIEERQKDTLAQGTSSSSESPPNLQYTENLEETLKLLLDSHFPDEKNTNISEIKLDDLIKNRKFGGIQEFITEKLVINAFKYFRPYKAPGPDGIYPIEIKKKTLPLIAPYLMEIYKESLKWGIIPEQWKKTSYIHSQK